MGTRGHEGRSRERWPKSGGSCGGADNKVHSIGAVWWAAKYFRSSEPSLRVSTPLRQLCKILCTISICLRWAVAITIIYIIVPVAVIGLINAIVLRARSAKDAAE